MKIVMSYPMNNEAKFIVDRKQDEVVGVIKTYISREIQFHLSGIDFPHQVCRKLKSLFDRFDEIHTIQLEKQLISLDPHSFEKIEDYLACFKELQLKLGECGTNYQNKDGKLIKLVLMNLRKTFNMFVSRLEFLHQLASTQGRW
jgi:hypothetical protein